MNKEKIKFVALFLMCVDPNLSYRLQAQPTRFETLETILQYSATPEEKFERLTELVSISWDIDLNLTKKYIDQALKLNPQISDSTKILLKFLNKVGVFWRTNAFDSVTALTEFVLGRPFTKISYLFKSSFAV